MTIITKRSLLASFFDFSIDRKYWIWVLSAILTYLCMPLTFYTLAAEDIDGSWKKAIVYAFEHRLWFGSDFIFTFGPLGFLQTRHIGSLSPVSLILFDIFIRVCFFYMFILILKRNSTLKYFLYAFALSYFLGFNYDEIMNMLILFLFYLFHDEKSSFKASVFIALILATLAFFIKVNIGLFLWAILIIRNTLSLIIEKENRLFWLGVCGLQLASMLLLVYVLRVNLIGYLLASWNIIDGYNDAMSIISFPSWYPTLRAGIWIGTKLVVMLAVVLFLGLIISSVITCFQGFWKLKVRNVLISAVLLFFTFVIFKQSFVRFDDYHLMIFFVYVPFIILLFCHLAAIDYGKLQNFLLTFTVVVVFVAQYFIGNLSTVYFYRYTGFNETQNISNLPDSLNTKLNGRLLDKVKNARIDIFPFDITYLITNHLNYQPRPVMQSYKAYNAYLMGENLDFYADILKSPDYVLYTSKSIDFRYPFWDDGYAKLKLLENFNLEDSFAIKKDTFLLLNKRSDRGYKLDTVNSFYITAKMNTEIQIPPSTGFTVLQPEIKYTLAGKLVRTVFQPSKLGTTFKYANGEIETFKAVLPIVNAGILCNYRLVNYPDMRNFYGKQFQNLTRVQSIKFNGSIQFLEEEFRIKVYELKLVPILETNNSF